MVERGGRQVAAIPLGPELGLQGGEQAQTRGKSQLSNLTLELAHYSVDLQMNSRSHLRMTPLMAYLIIHYCAGAAGYFHTPSKRSIVKLKYRSEIVVWAY